MSNYDDDYEPRSRGYRDDRAPPPYPSSAAPYDGYGASMPPPPPGPPPGQGTDVPPPPLGDQARRPSALKRSGSQSRVPHLQPQFPDEASYLGGNAPDLEAKQGRRHREFKDRRDGYESEEGEMHRKAKGSSRDQRGPPPPYDDRRRGDRDDPYDDRGGPPRRHTYDDEEPRRRKDRDRDRGDRDRDYDDPPSRHRRRDPPGVEYGSEPVPSVKRAQTDRDRRPRRRDDYDDDNDYDDDRRRRRPRSHDDARRRRRDDDDDDRSDYRDDRRRKDDRRDRDRDRDRDDRRRDRSRKRYSDDDDDDDRRDRDRDRHRRRSSAPPKEMKIGDFDLGPLMEKGKKHYGTIAPILTPIAMQMARKYLSGSKR